MILFGLNTCDTCRKARKALPAAAFRDVRADGVPGEVLEAALAEFGDALINRKSTTWRGLSDVEKDAPPQDLLTAHPTLMKRPLIVDGGVDGGRMTLGWSAEIEAVWAQA